MNARARKVSDKDDFRDGVQRAARVVKASLKLVSRVATHVDRLVTDLVRDSRTVAQESVALYESATVLAQKMGVTARATPRFSRLAREGATIAAAYKLHQVRLEWMDEEDAAKATEELHRRSAERMRDLAREMGGGLVKMAQFMSCRADLLPAVWIEALSELQDKAPAADPELVMAQLEEVYGGPLDEVFEKFEAEPVAAASLAQVHRATLKDGRTIALKVRRPGIEKLVETDLAVLRVIIALMKDFLPGVDLQTIETEIGRSLMAELDFSDEAQAGRDLRAAHQADARLAGKVEVPEVFDEWSNGCVVAMRFVEGERLSTVLDRALEAGEQAEVDRLLTTLAESMAAQIMRYGVFHADPHPGNLQVEAGRLVLLDFGAVGHLDATTQRGYAQLVGAMLQGAPDRIAALLDEMGFESEGEGTLQAYAELVVEIFRESAGRFENVDPAQQMARAMELARKQARVQIPEHFVLIGRALAALGGIYLTYKPEVNLMAVVGREVAAALAR